MRGWFSRFEGGRQEIRSYLVKALGAALGPEKLNMESVAVAIAARFTDFDQRFAAPPDRFRIVSLGHQQNFRRSDRRFEPAQENLHLFQVGRRGNHKLELERVGADPLLDHVRLAPGPIVPFRPGTGVGTRRGITQFRAERG